jgi:hypothetical protein
MIAYVDASVLLRVVLRQPRVARSFQLIGRRLIFLIGTRKIFPDRTVHKTWLDPKLATGSLCCMNCRPFSSDFVTHVCAEAWRREDAENEPQREPRDLGRPAASMVIVDELQAAETTGSRC